VFIPGGWWHAVLNLDDSIAITQNYCSITNFESVWRNTRKGRRKMARRWLSQLEEHYPALAQVACRLNEQDGFDMNKNPKDDKPAKKKRKH
jgi:histone arginine demethylase JMJD6